MATRVDIVNPPPEGQLSTPPVDPGAPAPAPVERPKGLPEKFKSIDEMVASYSELEKKLGSPKEPEPVVADEPAAKTEIPVPQEPAAPFLQKFEAEFAEKGELTPESYKELEAKGLSKDQVDTYIEGRQYRAQREQEAVFEAVGGQERWNEMMPWASKSLPEARINELNGMLAKGGQTAVIAAQALQTAYSEANGLDPQYVSPDGLSVGDGGVFESTAQVQAAMLDPRYKSDEAYRRRVAAKLNRSNQLL